ncbi:MAG: site-specific DNA-methyltransferase [Phycisphaerae bacterium]|nr:site-specific DNA-methyltransferase [Phycisphaerae bacterium]
MTYQPNSIVVGDCIQVLRQAAAEGLRADLVFADPPFNIGYVYDVYEDAKAYDEYYAWTRDWMAACAGVLKPNGSFWIAIGDEYAAEIRILGRQLGLTLRNWVIWHYTFGQATKRKFARCHAHLFYFTKHPKEFTFNDMAVRVPSARQMNYADARANPNGKVPDDVWSISRVCGTFTERVEWHPCQMPEKILDRILRASSNEGDLVMDPFNGSGTTAAAAARLGRQYFTVDISDTYVAESHKRIADTLAGKRPLVELSENPHKKRKVNTLEDKLRRQAEDAREKALARAAKRAKPLQIRRSVLDIPPTAATTTDVATKRVGRPRKKRPTNDPTESTTTVKPPKTDGLTPHSLFD